MGNEKAVKAAMECARGKGIQSCNKVVMDDENLLKSMSDLSVTLHKLRMRMVNKLPSTSNYDAAVVAEYALAAMEAKVGNCTELAAVAFLHLMGGKCGCNTGEKHCPLELVQVAGGNHAFLILGAKHEKTKDFMFGKKLFKEKDAYVCDPWAKIACHVSEYHSAWQSRMEKWENSQKRIVGGEFGKVIFMKPKEVDWIASINYKKLEIIGRFYG